MNEEKVFAATKKTRASGFIHIGEIIPGVMRDIERRVKESHRDKKASPGTEAEKEAS